jgi:hypothetical protein
MFQKEWSIALLWLNPGPGLVWQKQMQVAVIVIAGHSRDPFDLDRRENNYQVSSWDDWWQELI